MGQSSPMMIIFKNLSSIPRQLKKKFENDAILVCNSNGWMVETLMMTWIRDIWDNIIIPEGKKKFLVFDKFSVHAKATVLQALNEIDSEVQIIPAGCTGIL